MLCLWKFNWSNHTKYYSLQQTFQVRLQFKYWDWRLSFRFVPNWINNCPPKIQTEKQKLFYGFLLELERTVSANVYVYVRESVVYLFMCYRHAYLARSYNTRCRILHKKEEKENEKESDQCMLQFLRFLVMVSSYHRSSMLSYIIIVNKWPGNFDPVIYQSIVWMAWKCSEVLWKKWQGLLQAESRVRSWIP